MLGDMNQKIISKEEGDIVIKNIVFDIGNVILNFDYNRVVKEYTSNKKEQEFILNNIINSPEWLGYGLIDTGYITRKDAISIVKDRTNHINDSLIVDFWNSYNKYGYIDKRMLTLIKNLRKNGYKVFLLSNINPYTYDAIKDSKLFDIVDGYVLSYLEHQIKPYDSIYNTLIDRYKINPSESLYLDDSEKNIATGNKLGFISRKVEPDNYNSIIKEINSFIINNKYE